MKMTMTKLLMTTWTRFLDCSKYGMNIQMRFVFETIIEGADTPGLGEGNRIQCESRDILKRPNCVPPFMNRYL